MAAQYNFARVPCKWGREGRHKRRKSAENPGKNQIERVSFAISTAARSSISSIISINRGSLT